MPGGKRIYHNQIMTLNLDLMFAYVAAVSLGVLCQKGLDYTR
jgi:hypothetical protein